PCPRADGHLGHVAAQAVPRQGAQAGEGRRRRRRLALRRRGRPRPHRLGVDARDAVGRVSLDGRHLRTGSGRLLQRRRTAEGHGHRRCRRRGAVPAAAHDRPLPRRRGRRLRHGRHRGLQQLPVRRVHGARPGEAHRHGPDPVARHRRRHRDHAQGKGARLQGRRHLHVAVRRRFDRRRRRPVLGGGRRRNLISRRTRQKQRAAAAKAAKAGGDVLGVYGGKAAKANAKAVAGLGGVFSTVPSTIGQLIFTGVFDRFPELHVSMIETGVGWIPHLLEQIDDRYWRNRSWGNIPIKQPPSYYWFKNMSATFISDRNGIENRYGVGVDNIMWSTDYPHHGNDWPYSRKTISDMMGHIPADERRKIQGDNAVRIFNLER
ncbi:MAG: hypothetical protein E6G57_11625, partial [Actinobacteria bacterium]